MTDSGSAQLRVLQGPAAGRLIDLEEERITIGRRGSNRLQVLDPGVSGEHCEIVRSQGGGFVVRDLGSSNGTYLNGQQVTESPLADRDIVLIGQSAIQFSAVVASEKKDTTTLIVKEDDWTPRKDSDIVEKFPTAQPFEQMLEDPVAATPHLQRALQAVYQVSLVLNEAGQVEQQLKKIIQIILRAYLADRGCVVLQNEAADKGWEVAAMVNFRTGGDGFSVSRTILTMALEQGKSILTLDAEATEVFDASKSIGDQQVKSVLCVPVTTRDRCLGALYVDSLSRSGAFDREDLRLIHCVAHLVGEMLEKDRLRYEAEATREQLRVVLEEVPVGVFALDPEMRLIFWSRQMTRMLGDAPEDVIGRAGIDRFVVDPIKARIVLEQTMSGGHYEGELQCQTRRGTAMQCRLSMVQMAGPASERLRVIGSLTDISEREQLKSQLMQKQKLASLGLLLAGITHDLKNFITSLYGTAQLAERFPQHKDKLVESTLETSQSAIELIEDLLRFVRGADDPGREVDLGELVTVVLRLIDTQMIHSQIEVIRNFRATPPIRGVRSFLQDIFLNLILNAQQAMPGGGRLRITIEPRDDRVAVRIADSGIGIPSDQLGHIFEPFFTQHGEEGGSGLGLYMVKQIVDNHGGIITASSTVGEGTIFEIEFPVSGGPPLQPAPSAQPESGGSTTDDAVKLDTEEIEPIAQFLVGVDDEDTLETMREVLGAYRVDFAAGTDELFSEIRGHIVYTAAFLGADLSGTLPADAALRRLMTERPGLPVVVLGLASGDAFSDAVAVLRPPYDKADIQRVVNQLLIRPSQ